MGVITTRIILNSLAVFLLVLFLVSGCSKTPRTPEDVLDTPAHHVSSGFKLLQKNYDADAQREFELALQLDPYYSAAHRGLGLVYGKEAHFELALAEMRKAKDDASNGEQKAMAYVGYMRVYTMRKKPGWLNRVQERYMDAVRWKKDLPDAYFYMAMAYKEANRITDARQLFEKVIDLKKEMVEEARKELAGLGN